MPIWLTEHEYATLRAACAQMLPSAEDHPGAEEAGVADYIDGFLGRLQLRSAADLGRRPDVGTKGRPGGVR